MKEEEKKKSEVIVTSDEGDNKSEVRVTSDEVEGKPEDVIYDIDEKKPEEDKSEVLVTSDKVEESESEKSETEDAGEEAGDPALESIRKMIDDLGAEKVLELIRDNRNAAIEQIMEEMRQTREDLPPLHSGKSMDASCHSIFDLAAMA